MKKTKKSSYFISGAILIYFGLDELDNFSLLYDGLAIALGISSIVLGIVSKE